MRTKKKQKHATCPQLVYQARENMQLVPSAGKTSDCYQAWENMRPLPGAGKHAAATKRGKTFDSLPSAEKVRNRLIWWLGESLEVLIDENLELREVFVQNHAADFEALPI